MLHVSCLQIWAFKGGNKLARFIPSHFYSSFISYRKQLPDTTYGVAVTAFMWHNFIFGVQLSSLYRINLLINQASLLAILCKQPDYQQLSSELGQNHCWKTKTGRFVFELHSRYFPVCHCSFHAFDLCLLQNSQLYLCTAIRNNFLSTAGLQVCLPSPFPSRTTEKILGKLAVELTGSTFCISFDQNFNIFCVGL